MERGWIGGRGYDLAFFFGGSALAALVGVVLVAAPALVIPFWWAWVLLVDGPHLFATWTRSYLDPDDRRRQGTRLLTSLATFLPGVIAWAALAGTGERLPFDLFLLFATLWAYHHAIRQQYGILAIYHRHDGTPPGLRRIDSWILQGSLWGMYALFMLGHPASREALRLPRELSGGGRAAALAVVAALATALAVHVASIALRLRRGIAVRPALFVLLPVLALQAFALFAVGAFEPLVPNPAHVEQVFLAAAIVGGLPHGVQYLGIVLAANRRRYSSAGDRSFAARTGRSPARAYALCVALAGGYVLLNVVREGSPVPPALTPAFATTTSALFLALYWGLFFHHYWLDQHLWRVGRDPALRADLGLA